MSVSWVIQGFIIITLATGSDGCKPPSPVPWGDFTGWGGSAKTKLARRHFFYMLDSGDSGETRAAGIPGV